MTERLGSTVSVSTCVVVCVRVVKVVDKGGLPKIEAIIPGAFSACVAKANFKAHVKSSEASGNFSI